MNRRGFIKALAAVAVATQIPASWLPGSTLRRETALEYLRRAYNEWTHGRRGQYPRYIDVGRDLFDAAEGEMMSCWRFIEVDVQPHGRTLRFKGASLRARGHGWEIKAIHA